MNTLLREFEDMLDTEAKKVVNEMINMYYKKLILQYDMLCFQLRIFAIPFVCLSFWPSSNILSASFLNCKVSCIIFLIPP